MRNFLIISTMAFFSLANVHNAFALDEEEPLTVAMPVISPSGGPVAPGTQVTISCETEGAHIYYTTDGTTPTTESTPYSEPLMINEITVVNAIAALDGYSDSAMASALFTMDHKNAKTVTFNFTDAEFLMELLGLDAGNDLFTTKEGKYPVQNKTYTYENITLGFSGKGSLGAGANPRFYNNGNIIDFRFYLGQWFSVSLNEEEAYISQITFTKNATDPFSMEVCPFSSTNYDAENIYGVFTESLRQGVWVAPDGDKNVAVKFFNTTEEDTKVTTRISTMTVYTRSLTDGVESVSIANDGAAVEYFNLQGVRVVDPTAGQLLIKKQGNTVTKVIVR